MLEAQKAWDKVKKEMIDLITGNWMVPEELFEAGFKTAYESQQKRIEQLEAEIAELKAESPITTSINMLDIIEKLRTANEVLRDGLEFQSRYCECGTVTEHYSNGEHRGFDLHEEIEKALESADKIMKGE